MTPPPSSSAVVAAVVAAIALATTALTPGIAQIRGVKCYGIAKAGQNDCAHAKGYHLCAAEALVDYDGGDWKLVRNAEACEQAGGQIRPFEGRNPKEPKS